MVSATFATACSVGFTNDPMSDCVSAWEKGWVGSGTKAPQLVALLGTRRCGRLDLRRV